MRRLNDEQLAGLERIVEDGKRYLVLRTPDDVERVYRMHYPSYEEKQAAALEQHKYRSQLGKDKDLKTRRQIEREYAADLKALRKELSGYRRELERMQVEFIENEVAQGDFPDAEEQPDEFQKAIEKRSKALAEIQDSVVLVNSQIDSILSYSIEALAARHMIAHLTQKCWECTDDGDDWHPVWASWDAYASDQSVLAQRLLLETRLWLEGGAVPFVS